MFRVRYYKELKTDPKIIQFNYSYRHIIYYDIIIICGELISQGIVGNLNKKCKS